MAPIPGATPPPPLPFLLSRLSEVDLPCARSSHPERARPYGSSLALCCSDTLRRVWKDRPSSASAREKKKKNEKKSHSRACPQIGRSELTRCFSILCYSFSRLTPGHQPCHAGQGTSAELCRGLAGRMVFDFFVEK